MDATTTEFPVDATTVSLPETIVTWRWQTPGYRSKYSPETVNTLAAMVRRHYPHQHKFVCVTDDTQGIDPRVECLPDWGDYAAVPSPHGSRNPSCYRRLRAFHPDIASSFGPRFVSLDLDTVITDDVTPLWDRPEDFVIWGDTSPRSRFNGSMFEITAGARPQVWTDFDPATSPQRAKSAGFWGSDQGWLSYCLRGPEAKWTAADGVRSFRNDIYPHGRHLPDGTRIVFFHGQHDPWHTDVQAKFPWVLEHYRSEEWAA